MGTYRKLLLSTINHENDVFFRNIQLVIYNQVIALEISFTTFKTTKLTVKQLPREISGDRPFWSKFQEISGNFPDEISGLTPDVVPLSRAV